MKIINLIALLFLVSCMNSSKTTNLKASQFNEKVSTSNVQILDVRTSEEFDQGHIKGAINVDVNSDNFDVDVLKLDNTKPVYVYCLAGVRSNDAAEKMKALGFDQIFQLDGGIKSWNTANLPLDKTPVDTTKISQVTETEEAEIPFEEAIKKDKLVLVDFNAVWCGPCKKMQPHIDKLKEARKSDVLVYSIDTDKNPVLSSKYNVQLLPTIMLFKKDKTLHRIEGYQDYSSLEKLVNKYK